MMKVIGVSLAVIFLASIAGAMASPVDVSTTGGGAAVYVETTQNVAITFPGTHEMTQLAFTLPAKSATYKYALVTLNAPNVSGSGQAYFFIGKLDQGNQVGTGQATINLGSGIVTMNLVELIPLTALRQSLVPIAVAQEGNLATNQFMSVSAVLLGGIEQ